MVDTHTHGCLEPEVLAAYVDHGLSLTERARVEGHLASCPQCTALLAGVVRTVAEIAPVLPQAVETVEAPSRVSWRVAGGAVAAAAAVIAVLAVPSLLRPWLERDAELVSLAGSVGEQRSVLGRLTGGFPHAPLDVSSAGGQDDRAAGTDRVLLTAGRIRESVGETATPSRLHALGVSQLLARRYDDAALLLLAASREQPANARYLNDVAAVQLERARRGLRPDDLPRALAAADRARRLDPSLREAWFNRALAMSALRLTDQARSAWTEYLRRDSGSSWAAEAREHLKDLARPTPAAAWAEIAGRLQQSIDPSSADAAVRAQTTEARNFIETDLFVAWSDAVLAGEPSDVEFDRLRVMADAMLRVAGDAMYSDAVAAIGRAASADVKQRFAQAHAAYARASALFNQDSFREAMEPLANARAQLQSLGSPLSLLADVQIAAVNYVAGRHAQADNSLSATLAEARAHNYAYAAARATWFKGLIAFAQVRMAEAQILYEETLATLERMGDVEQSSMAHILLSGVHDLLGNSIAEWEHRQLALAGLDVSRSPRFRYTVLLSGALSTRDDDPEAALVMLESVIAEARSSGRDAAIVDGLAQRAATLLKLGRTSEAQSVIGNARAHLANVRDESFRRLLELPVFAVESDLLRPTNSRAAADAAQRAIETAVGRGDRARLPQLQLRLAKAHIAGGRLDAAERALAAGIAAFDETRAKPAGVTGIAAFDESWQLFETAVQLALRRGDHERAFALAERGRVYNGGVATRVQVVTLADVQRAQAPDEAIIALNQFDDEVALWVIRQNGTVVVRQPMRRADAERIVARQQDEIRLETNAPTAGAALYDTVIRPLTNHLAGVKRVTFVPDSTYRDVSFAALWDRSRDRFLVENWTLSESPTVALVAAASRDRAARKDSDSILVLSSDAAVAKTIADQHRNADVAVGVNATRAKVLGGTNPVMHLSVPTYRSATYPQWSRLMLSDEPGRRYSGALLAREIASQPMPMTRLVVLDELRTQQRYQTAGTFDLATAFLAAGVPAVLGTLPGADEHETRELIVGFHRQMAAQASAAETLARIQRNALQQNGRRVGAWTALVMYGSDR
jgi:CHAT domain-containing protein